MVIPILPGGTGRLSKGALPPNAGRANQTKGSPRDHRHCPFTQQPLQRSAGTRHTPGGVGAQLVPVLFRGQACCEVSFNGVFLSFDAWRQ